MGALIFYWKHFKLPKGEKTPLTKFENSFTRLMPCSDACGLWRRHS